MVIQLPGALPACLSSIALRSVHIPKDQVLSVTVSDCVCMGLKGKWMHRSQSCLKTFYTIDGEGWMIQNEVSNNWNVNRVCPRINRRGNKMRFCAAISSPHQPHLRFKHLIPVCREKPASTSSL